MAISTLLRVGDSQAERSVWRWEHAMAHRTVNGAMSPTSRFSVLPYFIEALDFSDPQSLLNHQQAHNDMAVALPTFFGGDIPGLGTPSQSAPLTPNLRDNTTAPQWWIFANHQTHLFAAETLPSDLVFPFW